MNYRHDYHAGNFADVVKHVVLACVLTYMKQKPRPFRVIDTHAGAGRYDLSGLEPGKTGEWQDGIGRLFDAELPGSVADLLAPYLDAVRAVNDPGQLRYYPGSPVIARQLMRFDDVLVANELNGEDFDRLKAEFRRSKSTTVLNIDAWHAVKSLLPPKERRGLVLIDPPFENRDEFANLTAAVGEATRRIRERHVFDLVPAQKRGCRRPLRRYRHRAIASRISRYPACGLFGISRSRTDGIRGSGTEPALRAQERAGRHHAGAQ